MFAATASPAKAPIRGRKREEKGTFYRWSLLTVLCPFLGG